MERDPRVEAFLEEVWRGTGFGESIRSLKNIREMVWDCENQCSKFHTLYRAMMKDPKVDIALFQREQEMKGDSMFRRAHAAATEMQAAHSELLAFFNAHRKGAPE